MAGTTSLDLLTAFSINESGEIIGLAVDINTGEMHAYRAAPTAGGSGGLRSSK